VREKGVQSQLKSQCGRSKSSKSSTRGIRFHFISIHLLLLPLLPPPPHPPFKTEKLPKHHPLKEHTFPQKEEEVVAKIAMI
jgi:hypothetical protein